MSPASTSSNSSVKQVMIFVIMVAANTKWNTPKCSVWSEHVKFINSREATLCDMSVCDYCICLSVCPSHHARQVWQALEANKSGEVSHCHKNRKRRFEVKDEEMCRNLRLKHHTSFRLVHVSRHDDDWRLMTAGVGLGMMITDERWGGSRWWQLVWVEFQTCTRIKAWWWLMTASVGRGVDSQLNSHEHGVAGGVLDVTSLKLYGSSIWRHFRCWADPWHVSTECRQIHRLPTHNVLMSSQLNFVLEMLWYFLSFFVNSKILHTFLFESATRSVVARSVYVHTRVCNRVSAYTRCTKTSSRLLTMPRTMKHEPMNAKQNIGPAS